MSAAIRRITETGRKIALRNGQGNDLTLSFPPVRPRFACTGRRLSYTFLYSVTFRLSYGFA